MLSFEFFSKMVDWIGLSDMPMQRREEIYLDVSRIITNKYGTAEVDTNKSV